MLISKRIQEEQKNFFSPKNKPTCCRRCKKGNLKRDSIVARAVRFLEDFRVKIRHISVGVWVCLDCFVRFRHLPDYIEAYKRYVKPTQMALARRYLLRLWGYRMTAEAGRGSPQVYENRNMSFVHATVWRWVGEFGGRLQKLLIDLASQNIQLELQKSEGFPRWKFQSEPRLALLNDSFQALEIFQRIETGDHLGV